MSEATQRIVLVLGSEDEGNRHAVVVESGETYDIDYATVVEYDDATAEFPYEG